ncbi:MAG: sulfurase [Gemmatimonadales bacterium]|nr:sulfurase [Gemmatimonadales bacterium]MYG48114.1 sulfurase [Gemmatimonadales bacterium]MYK00445.1 sulfurase [Candidatus Palauibacter ramosifaciens]
MAESDAGPAGSGPARLEAIWLKPARKGDMEPVTEATLVAGKGLEGNVDRGGYRQVTLLDADAWETATREVGVDLAPDARRANLLVRGVDFSETANRVLRIAGCRIRIRGETLPCARMEDAAPGLKAALAPDWRGGAYGMVLEGGPLALGDAVAWES